MSDFLDALAAVARGSAGMTTGEPRRPVRATWAEVRTAALAGAQLLAARGLRPGDAVAVLAGQPAEVAPAAQAVWLAGGSVTMLHQPTARTEPGPLRRRRCQTVLGVIGARFVMLGEPFADSAGAGSTAPRSAR